MSSHDLLNQTMPPSAAAAPRRRRWRRWVGIVVVVALLVMGALMVVAAGRVASSLSTTKEAASRAEAALRDGDFSAADDALAEALASIQSARGGLNLVPFLKILPWVGTQLKGLGYTLAAGEETISALREAVSIAADLQEVTAEAQRLVGITDGDVPYSELATSARVALLEALHDAHPQLLTMQMKLTLAREDIARLEGLNVAPALQSAIAPFSELVLQLADAIDLMAPFSAVVPELTGLHEDRQLLMLFANNTELRPSGGFIGVYGLTVTHEGEVVAMTTDDVYNIDNLVSDDGYQVTAPEPLRKYLGVPKWYFRDSNWSPDFPTSVQTSVQLLRQEASYAGLPVPEIHGVLMFTPTFVGRLLDFVGPVEIDGQVFTSANVADKLEYEVELGYAQDGIPPHQRKDLVARMTDTVVDRLLSLPSSSWPSLFVILKDGFAEKELALWSADTATQATYADAGWAGAVEQETADDVLMVVDANLAALKTDPVVDRTIEYTVVLTTRGYEATVNITYEHNGSFDWKTTRYRTYTRVYAPLGSTLISSNGTLANDKLQNPSGAEGEVTTVDELGMTSFGAFTSVEPGDTHTLTFTYLLPESVSEAVDDGLYELRVIKQIGADDHDLVLNLDFNRNISRAEPGEEEAQWGDDTYHIETDLDTDKTFLVRM